MTIQFIHVHKRINGNDHFEIFEDNREIKCDSELEKYRTQIEECFKKKYKAETEGVFTVEVLFTLKNTEK
jgi:hypothetical protein